MPLKPPTIDDRSFEDIVAEAIERIPVHTPEWTNYNHSDPGVTLLQLFAYMTENLLYRSSRIPEANRVKFLQLMGIGLQPPAPARGLVQFRNEKGNQEPFAVEKGARLRAGDVPFRTQTPVNVLPVLAKTYYKRRYEELTEKQKKEYRDQYATVGAENLVFYRSTPLEEPAAGRPWPEIDLADRTNGPIDGSMWIALLQRDGHKTPEETREDIAGQTLTLGIYPSRDVEIRTMEAASAHARPASESGLIYEIAAAERSSPQPVPEARYTRLHVEYAENVLEAPGIVQLTLPENAGAFKPFAYDPIEEGIADFPPYVEDPDVRKRIVTWIRVRLPKSSEKTESQMKAKLTWVGINAARVIQAISVENERLGVGTGAPNQTVRIANTPVIAPTDTALHPQMETRLTLEVEDDKGQWRVWKRTDDLYAAGPEDRVFRLDPESGEVRFGDGLRGKRPPLNRAMRVSYEHGGGVQGRVPIGAINTSASGLSGIKIRNPLATWGADPGETVEQGERNIPRLIKHRDRLVTAEDFEDITLRTPGANVARVEAMPLFDPSAPDAPAPGALTVVVIPEHDVHQRRPPTADRHFLNAVCDYLAPRRLITTEIYVRGPEFVRLWVTAGITTMPGHLQAQVQRDVQRALRRYLSPLVGSPMGTGWQLNMSVHKADLEAVVVRVEGVRYVNTLRMGTRQSGVVQPTDEITIEAIQLPWLMDVAVNEGEAPDLDAFNGRSAEVEPSIPVPVQVKEC